MLDKVIKITKIKPVNVRNLYLFGSRVYGCHSPESDYDFILVGNGLKRRQVEQDRYNVHIFSTETFQNDINKYYLRALESIMSPDFAKIKETDKYNFKFKKDAFKTSILDQSNRNWSQARTKFRTNIDVGKKKVYHSLRIIDFGIQILQHGKITDWQQCNWMVKDIKKNYHKDWEYYRDMFDARRNEQIKKLLSL